jgi:hypothetical protein
MRTLASFCQSVILGVFSKLRLGAYRLLLTGQPGTYYIPVCNETVWSDIAIASASPPNLDPHNGSFGDENANFGWLLVSVTELSF